MKPFFYFIINKQSRKSKKTFNNLLILLPRYTKKYQLLVTESIEQLENLLLELQQKIQPQDIIVVVGGDGSLNQFITLYEKYQLKNYIGYIPSGSGNDFARTHKIPTDTKKAVDYLFHVTEKQNLSIIHASENSGKYYAVNSIGIGIDGLIIHLVNSMKLKEKLGPFSYLSAVFNAFSKQKKFSLTLKVDNETYQFKNVQLALVANNPYFGGGINIIPHADGKDSELNVLIADNFSLKDLVLILPRILTNQSHLLYPKFHSFASKKITLTIDSAQYGQKDGEVFRQKEFNYNFQTKILPFWI